MELSHLLIATDLSAQSGLAARWAHHLKAFVGADIIAAHIVELTLPNWLRGKYEISDDSELYTETETRVRKWFETHTDVEPDVISILVGDPYNQLRQAMESYAEPALVTSKSGKGRLHKLWTGSTTQALATNPPGPLIVANDTRAGLNEGMTVAMACDLTEFSVAALEFAADITRAIQGTLHIVHALGLEDLPKWVNWDQVRQEAPKRLEAYVHSHAELLEGVSVETVLLENNPISALRDYVDQEDIQLLVAGHVNRADAIIDNNFSRVTLKLLNEVDTTLAIIPIGDGQ